MNKLKELLGKSFKLVMFIIFTIVGIIYLHHRRRMALLCPVFGRCIVLGNHQLEILEETREKRRKRAKSEIGLMPS